MAFQNDIIEDLNLISKVDDRSIDQVIDYLATNKILSYSDSIKFEEFCVKFQIQSGLVIRRFLKFYSEWILKFNDHLQGKERIEKILSQSLISLPDAKLGWERIKKFSNRIPEIIDNLKFDTLSYKFSRLDSFEIINEIRPIFDANREKIIGNLTPYIVKITTVDGEQLTCEFYDDDLIEIKKEIELAEKKNFIINKKYS